MAAAVRRDLLMQQSSVDGVLLLTWLAAGQMAWEVLLRFQQLPQVEQKVGSFVDLVEQTQTLEEQAEVFLESSLHQEPDWWGLREKETEALFLVPSLVDSKRGIGSARQGMSPSLDSHRCHDLMLHSLLCCAFRVVDGVDD